MQGVPCIGHFSFLLGGISQWSCNISEPNLNYFLTILYFTYSFFYVFTAVRDSNSLPNEFRIHNGDVITTRAERYALCPWPKEPPYHATKIHLYIIPMFFLSRIQKIQA